MMVVVVEVVAFMKVATLVVVVVVPFVVKRSSVPFHPERTENTVRYCDTNQMVIAAQHKAQLHTEHLRRTAIGM